MEEDLSACLAGITLLDVHTRSGTLPVYLFDPHRLALPAWAHALAGRGPAVLLTLDRHADLVLPDGKVPKRAAGLRALDEHARWVLSPKNNTHILAAMEAGLIGNALCVARTALPGGLSVPTWVDSYGEEHHVHVTPTLARLCDGFATASPGVDAQRAQEWLLPDDVPWILDVDLDAFTTPSDADPTSVVPWPASLVREFLFPPGAAALWERVLAQCVAVTVAREPLHCGGVTAASKLFDVVAQVLFVELLGADVP